MKTSELLKAAKAKIAYEKCWTQGASARDAIGDAVDYTHDSAVCYCSTGILTKLLPKSPQHVWRKAWDALSKATCGFIAVYNDNHTHAEVMAKWDEAIKLAEDDGD